MVQSTPQTRRTERLAPRQSDSSWLFLLGSPRATATLVHNVPWEFSRAQVERLEGNPVVPRPHSTLEVINNEAPDIAVRLRRLGSRPDRGICGRPEPHALLPCLHSG